MGGLSVSDNEEDEGEEAPDEEAEVLDFIHPVARDLEVYSGPLPYDPELDD